MTDNKFRVVATDNCINLPDLHLASFETLDEAEQYRPANATDLITQGYKWLEICPRGWADTASGFAPFARMELEAN